MSQGKKSANMPLHDSSECGGVTILYEPVEGPGIPFQFTNCCPELANTLTNLSLLVITGLLIVIPCGRRFHSILTPHIFIYEKT